MNKNTPRVLDVGQCDFDHGNLSKLLKEEFGCDVQRSSTEENAITAMEAGSFDLVLINRVFDLDGTCGLEFIETLKRKPGTHDVPVMLVSNFEDDYYMIAADVAITGSNMTDLFIHYVDPNNS